MKKWIGVPIEDYGAYTSPMYNRFQRDYKQYLKRVAKDIGATLYSFHPNHYEFSAVFERNNKFVYFSISDVRYWRGEWYKHILVRAMRHAEDWTGMGNCYTDLPHARENINKIFEKRYC